MAPFHPHWPTSGKIILRLEAPRQAQTQNGHVTVCDCS